MLYLWLFISLLVLVASVYIAIYQFRLNSSYRRIGYLPTFSRTVLKNLSIIIQTNIKSPKEVDFVELGSGIANVANWASKSFDFKEVVAVEIDPVTLYLGRFLSFIKRNKTKFLLQDIFDYKPQPKSMLYCYLTHTILKDLFAEGRLDGCLVVSVTFEIPDQEPVQTIDVGGFYRKMFVYDFRK